MKITSVQNTSNITVVSDAINYQVNKTIELGENRIIVLSNTQKSVNIIARVVPPMDVDVLLYPNLTINQINQNIDGGIIF